MVKASIYESSVSDEARICSSLTQKNQKRYAAWDAIDISSNNRLGLLYRDQKLELAYRIQ